VRGTDVGPSRDHEKEHHEMTRSQPLRPLAALLAAGAVAAPAATARPFHHHSLPDAHHAALVQRDLRAAAQTSSLAGTTAAPTSPHGPVAAPGGGVDAAPLAGGLAALVAAFGAGVALYRRPARTAV
jgi:hypothetical protein